MSKNGAAFTKAHPDPEDFDVEEWLDEITLKEVPVPIYTDGAGYGELQDLLTQYEAAVEADEGDNESLGSVGLREQFRVEYEALRQRVEASKRVIRVRSATMSQVRAIREELGPDGSNDEYQLRLVASQCVRPKMTVEQVRKLCDRLDPANYSQLVDAANEASFAPKVGIPSLPAPLRRPGTPE